MTPSHTSERWRGWVRLRRVRVSRDAVRRGALRMTDDTEIQTWE